MGSLSPPPLAKNSLKCGHQPRERVSLQPEGQGGTEDLLRWSPIALEYLCCLKTATCSFGDPTVPPSVGVSHTPSHIHTYPYPETNSTSVFECQSVLIFYSNRPSLKRTQNSWEPEVVMSRMCVCVSWRRSCTNFTASCLCWVWLRWNGVDKCIYQ